MQDIIPFNCYNFTQFLQMIKLHCACKIKSVGFIAADEPPVKSMIPELDEMECKPLKIPHTL